MEVLISPIREDKTHHVIYISFEPENERAKRVYESLGFVPDGRMAEDEVVYMLKYE